MSARQKFRKLAASKKLAGAKPAPEYPMEARDGPTAEFRERHDTISRGKDPGRRVYSKLERLLRTRQIRPEESEAGWRFKTDFQKGVVGRGRSCLDIGSGGGGDGHPSMERIDAFTRARHAATALDTSNEVPRSQYMAPSAMLILFVVDDMAYPKIGEQAGKDEKTVKVWVGTYLKVLAEHYKAIDKKAGREVTAYTVEHALKRFDPQNDV